MKYKILLASFAFMAMLGFSSVASATTTATYVGNAVHFDSGVGSTTVYIFRADTHAFMTQKSALPTTNTYVDVYHGEFEGAGVVNGAYEWLSATGTVDCSALVYSTCDTAITAGKISSGTLDMTPTLANLSASGLAGFTAMTTTTYSEVVDKVGTYLIQMLGGGLGLVDALIGWIIAIIIITVIIRLIFHGLRWLHVLR